jgi:hypothetical protein
MEINVKDPQNKHRLPYDPAIHSWACIQRNVSQHTTETPVYHVYYSCSGQQNIGIGICAHQPIEKENVREREREREREIHTHT